MNDADFKHWRLRLEGLRDELTARADTSQDATRTVELDQQSVGRLSRMDAMQAQQMARETERRRQLQLQKVAGALRRLDDGDFGICVACDEDIDPRRLEVDPTATRCITCSE